MGLSYIVDPVTNKSLFTYFSEFDKQWEQSYILENAVVGLLAVVSLGGNLLVISFFVRFSAIRQVTNLFITNLALSDMIFSLMVPLVMTTRVTGNWIFGEVPCHMLTAVEFICGISSVWTMVLISVDRYQAIVTLQRRRSTLTGALMRILLVWIGAFIFVLPLMLFFRTVDSTIEDGRTARRNVTVCSFDFPGPSYLPLIYSCVNMFVVFIIPTTIITRNYRAVMRKFSTSLQRMRDHMEAGPKSNSNSIRSSANVQREARVMRMLLTMVIAFVLMWGPITMTIIALMADYEKQVMESYQLTAVYIVTSSNAAINPVVYGILNAQYRGRFGQFFCKTRCKEMVTSDTMVHGQASSLRQRQVICTLSGKERDKPHVNGGRRLP